MTVVFAKKKKKNVFWISQSKTYFKQIQTILHDFLRTCEYFTRPLWRVCDQPIEAFVIVLSVTRIL